MKRILAKLKFLRLSVFKILQFKLSRFFLSSVLPFCRYCDRRLTFGKLIYIYWKGRAVTRSSLGREFWGSNLGLVKSDAVLA